MSSNIEDDRLAARWDIYSSNTTRVTLLFATDFNPQITTDLTAYMYIVPNHHRPEMRYGRLSLGQVMCT